MKLCNKNENTTKKLTEPTLFKSETKCKRRERACPALTTKNKDNLIRSFIDNARLK